MLSLSLSRSPRAPSSPARLPELGSRALQAREGPLQLAVVVLAMTAAVRMPEEPGPVRGVPGSPLRCALCIRRARLSRPGCRRGARSGCSGLGGAAGGCPGGTGLGTGIVNTSRFSPLLPGSYDYYYYFLFSLSGSLACARALFLSLSLSPSPSVQSARPRCRPAGGKGVGGV